MPLVTMPGRQRTGTHAAIAWLTSASRTAAPASPWVWTKRSGQSHRDAAGGLRVWPRSFSQAARPAGMCTWSAKLSAALAKSI